MNLCEFYSGKKVAVLGATGLIGSYMTKELKDLGAKIRIVHHSRPLNEFVCLWNANAIQLDLLDLSDAREAVFDADIVMNCAGITGGIGLAMTDPTSFVGPNAVLGANVLEACYREKVPLVGHLSSTVVYSPTDQPVSEDKLDFGVDPYPLYFGIAWMKRFLEKLCMFYQNTGKMKIGVIRPSNAYGRFDNFDEKTSHVLPALINRALREKEVFTLWGDGKDVRDFTHASDIARGLLLTVMLEPTADPINIASGCPVTTLELAKMVLKAVGSNAEIQLDATKPSALPIRKVSIKKAQALLDYCPKVSLEEGIKDTVSWWLQK